MNCCPVFTVPPFGGSFGPSGNKYWYAPLHTPRVNVGVGVKVGVGVNVEVEVGVLVGVLVTVLVGVFVRV